VQLLQKLLGKKLQNNGFVGISYLPDGIAVAVSNYVDNNKLRLNYCEFISRGCKKIRVTAFNN